MNYPDLKEFILKKKIDIKDQLRNIPIEVMYWVLISITMAAIYTRTK